MSQSIKQCVVGTALLVTGTIATGVGAEGFRAFRASFLLRTKYSSLTKKQEYAIDCCESNEKLIFKTP